MMSGLPVVSNCVDEVEWIGKEEATVFLHVGVLCFVHWVRGWLVVLKEMPLYRLSTPKTNV